MSPGFDPLVARSIAYSCPSPKFVDRFSPSIGEKVVILLYWCCTVLQLYHILSQAIDLLASLWSVCLSEITYGNTDLMECFLSMGYAIN